MHPRVLPNATHQEVIGTTFKHEEATRLEHFFPFDSSFPSDEKGYESTKKRLEDKDSRSSRFARHMQGSVVTINDLVGLQPFPYNQGQLSKFVANMNLWYKSHQSTQIMLVYTRQETMR